MKRWGPWTEGQLNRLRYDIRRYFRTCYAELRKLIAAHKDADLPYWFRGGRQIASYACTDGVVVVHTPFDPESLTYPEREDSYKFRLAHGFTVGACVDECCTPTFPDGSRLEVMQGYRPGEDFGHFVRLWPAYVGYPAGDEYGLGNITNWTRLDAASMSNLHVWRDRKPARREAWEALRPYVEGDDLPVPRPL